MIRVGVVDYLNSRPLAWGLVHGPRDRRLVPEFHSPARVAEKLLRGDLEVGLIPSIEYQRIADLELVPGPCVASQREVRSVLLVARKPLSEVRRVALDRNSRTSAALVQILLAERYGAAPEFVQAEPEVERMLETSDAALVIGDAALHIRPGAFEIHDLAREWWRLTGLPFVFAVWAARPGTLTPEMAGRFSDSLDAGLAELELLALEAAEELGLEADEVRHYLTHNLSYRLEAREIEALELYYRRAREHRLIERVSPLRFFGGAPR